MKKVLIGFMLLVVVGVSVITYLEFSFSPLKQYDFEKLFVGYDGGAEKTCFQDLLGISAKSEFYEVYSYQIKGAVINNDFRNIDEWEGKKITRETSVGAWRNCPLDSQTAKLYDFTLSFTKRNDLQCGDSIANDLANPDNLYCYVSYNGLEQYFLVYSKHRQELYYIRRKGF